MKNSHPIFVLSLGGSIVVPKEGIDVKFLKRFRRLVLAHTKKGARFILICGGGATARTYQSSVSHITKLKPDDVDWLGIHATRLNAHLLKTIFNGHTYRFVVKDPTRKVPNWKESILVASGWKPGWSTDYDAVRLAEQFNAGVLINLSNIDTVFDKDPRKYKDAMPICDISWKEFRKLVGTRWDPGAHTPFDPVAARHAERIGLQVIIANGRNIKNLENILAGKSFVGTVIST